MASFKTECVGGPLDGARIDLHRAPQDGEIFTTNEGGRELVYQYFWNGVVLADGGHPRWRYVTTRIPAAKQ